MNKSSFIDPTLFSLAAAFVGEICTGDLDDYELNAIGNWIILVGQYILTYASQVEYIESKFDNHNINANSKIFKNGGSPYTNNQKSNQNQRMEVEYLLNAMRKLQDEIEKLNK